MVNGVVIQVLGRNGLLDNLVLDLLAQLLRRDVGRVLGRDDNRVDADGHDGTVVVLVLDRHLRLRVGPQPGQGTVAAGGRHGRVELVGKHEGEGEELGRLVRGIAKHDALVAGAETLERLLVVEALGDVGRLLLDGHEEVARLVVEALGRVVVANVLDGVTDNLLVVELGLRRDFAKDHDHARLGGRLAGHLGQGVLGQAGVEDGIRDLVGNLVGVTLTDGLGGEDEAALGEGGAVDTVGTVGGHREWVVWVVELGGGDWGGGEEESGWSRQLVFP